MASIDGRVLEMPKVDETTTAYLYGFGVDVAQPGPEHRRWLSGLCAAMQVGSLFPVRKMYDDFPTASSVPRDPIVPPSSGPTEPTPYHDDGSVTVSTWAPPGPPATMHRVVPERWLIWLVGTTSRTGTARHNLGLSERRARAVAQQIRRLLDVNPLLKYSIEPGWMGELWAAARGQPEHWEDPLDRAVLVAFRPVYPNSPPARLQPPPPVQRPGVMPCCMKTLMLEYYQLVKDAWAYTIGSHKLRPGGSRTVTNDVYVQPDRTFTHALLNNRGWGKRVTWMLDNGLYMNVLVTEMYGITTRIQHDIDNLKSLQCYQADPDEMCKNDETFSKTNGPRW